MNKWVEWRGDPFLKILTHCQVGICGGFLRLYANQKCIKAPVSQQSLQWWVFILVFHFDSQVDGRGETLLLILFLKVVQVCLFVCFELKDRRILRHNSNISFLAMGSLVQGTLKIFALLLV